MSHYRKIDTRIWNDSKFNRLSNLGKLSFIFVLTHPNMTPLGAMRGSMVGLSDEIDVPMEAFHEPFDKGMLKADKASKIIYAPNFLKYNKPESPNVVIAWGKCFDMIPECCVKTNIFKTVKGLVKDYGRGFQEAFEKSFGKSMPNSEQEQEQD